jgi:hypothetical protein
LSDPETDRLREDNARIRKLLDKANEALIQARATIEECHLLLAQPATIHRPETVN